MPSEHVQWRHFNSPIHLWSTMPYLLFFEIVAYIAFGLCCSHALLKPRRSLGILLASWVGGAMTDFAFSVLPNGNNFWHAQATVMLTSRVPLYVPCLYTLMLYLPHELMRKAQLPLIAKASLGGIFAALMLNPFDNLSSTFLFTTWHDSDPALFSRLAGNPAGNLLFCLGFGFSFHLLLGARLPGAAGFAAVASGAGAVLFCTAVQLGSGNASGAPRNAEVAIGALALLLLLLCSLALRRAAPRHAVRRPAWRLCLAHGLFHGALLGLAVFGDPERQASTGLHQTRGACGEVEEVPLSGLRRGRFLCPESFKESFRLNCAQPPTANPSWYTVCGVPNRDYLAHVVSTATAFFVSLLLGEVLGVVKCGPAKAEKATKQH